MVASVPCNSDYNLLIPQYRREEEITHGSVRCVIHQNSFSPAYLNNLCVCFVFIRRRKHKKLPAGQHILFKPPALVPDLSVQNPSSERLFQLILSFRSAHPDAAAKRKKDAGSPDRDIPGADNQDLSAAQTQKERALAGKGSGEQIGDGFAASRLKGTHNADRMLVQGFASNHAGGVLGGISTSAPIVARVAIKPTPSVSSPLESLDEEGNPVVVVTKGRHDPCVGLRAAPVLEAVVALVLADAALMQMGQCGNYGRPYGKI